MQIFTAKSFWMSLVFGLRFGEEVLDARRAITVVVLGDTVM